MTAHIDWVTIVGRREVDETDWSVHNAYVTAVDALADNHPTFTEAFGNPERYQIVKPRAPYSYARRSDDATRTLYVHPLSAHFTFEAAGTHCQRIPHLMPSLMHQFGGMFSRIDLAVDIETDVTPLEFDKAIDAPLIKTRSKMESSTGQTVYIGSRSSERFARVYRYYAPHPRAKLLRVEFQYKGDYANALASEIAAGVTLDSLASGAGEHFGMKHGCWLGRAVPVPVRVKSHAQSGSTVQWLTTTVAPLLRRLDAERKLDVKAWFAEYVTNHE